MMLFKTDGKKILVKDWQSGLLLWHLEINSLDAEIYCCKVDKKLFKSACEMKTFIFWKTIVKEKISQKETNN